MATATKKGRRITKKEATQRLIDYYTNAYKEYRDDVLSGKRAAGQAELQMVLRQERDLKEGVSGFVFDIKMALRPLLWIYFNLCFPLGDKVGQPLLFEPWQAYIIMVLFGWVDEKDSRKRRFVDAFIEIARKNGKSTFTAALLCYLAFGEVKAAQCYIAATCLSQAGDAFKRAGNALKFRHKEVSVSDSANYKSIKWKTGEIQAISAAPKDGKLAHAAIIDEYHQHKDNALVNSIHSGNVSEIPSLLIRITTAGTDTKGVCHQEYEKCKRIVSGELSVDRYFVAIFELDEGDDPEDQTCWIKANPNMGVSVSQDLLVANYESARPSETDWTDFRTKNLNVWCSSLSTWANMEIWRRDCSWEYDLAELDGHLAYGGLDLAAVYDFTSFTLDFPLPEDRHVQLSHFWIPESKREYVQRTCRIPLSDWVRDGYVTCTQGEVTDYSVVAAYIEAAFNRYKIPIISCDEWNIQALIQHMPDWFAEIAVRQSQGMKAMSPIIKEYERAYLTGKITALGNPVMDWMMGCCKASFDPNGNVKLIKPQREKAARIDGVITSVMALSTAQVYGTELDADTVNDMISFF